MILVRRLKYIINETKAQLVIVSKSNYNTNDPSMLERGSRNFPRFLFIDKVLPGSTTARLSVFVAKELEHERMTDMENDFNSTAVLRVRKSGKKWTYIIGSYRQWKGVS